MSKNYIDLYKKNLDYKESPEYLKIKQHFDLIYNPTSSKCPIKNGGKLVVVYNTDNIFISCENKPEWYIKITREKVVDINLEYLDLKRTMDKCLYEIDELLNQDQYEKNNKLNKDTFDNIKKTFIGAKKNYNEIEQILNNEKDEMDKLKDELFKKKYDLGQLYFTRKDLFKLITTPLTNKLSIEVMKLYNKDSKPSEGLLKSFAKEHKIPLDEVMKIMKWINISGDYILLQMKVKNLESKLSDVIENITNINTKFIIKFSELDESNQVTTSSIDKKAIKKKIKLRKTKITKKKIIDK